MSIRNPLEKTVYEEFPISGNFSRVLEDGETLDAASYTVIFDEDGVDKTAEMLPGDNQRVGALLTTLIIGGTLGVKYNMSFVAKTSLGNTWEVRVEVEII